MKAQIHRFLEGKDLVMQWLMPQIKILRIKKKLISISQCHYGSIQWEWPSCVTLEIIKGRHFESLELLDAEVPK